MFPTRRAVIAKIQERRELRLPLNYSSLKGRGSGLLSAAKRLFGSWDKAIEAAGLDPAKIRKKPMKIYTSPELVLAGIRKRAQANLPLNATAVFCGPHSWPSLHARAVRYFGCWDKAIEAAGFKPYETRKAGKYPTRESVMLRIQERHRRGLPLKITAVNFELGANHGLRRAARRFFGDWNTAVQQALNTPPL